MGGPLVKTLPISIVKTKLTELVTGVEEREEEVIVTRKGKPAAVLINYAEYERLKETVDVLSDPDLLQQLRKSQAFYQKGKRGLSFEEVFCEPMVPRKNARRR
ncbi:MAG: type II toxin-antitoxin system Phd/YefM family antitoxin [Nitrospirae bacterium]|nr:MAG: type II toxin-antitoxin system Phd/YefM family antitoxin [Nitrospirota bacterium]